VSTILVLGILGALLALALTVELAARAWIRYRRRYYVMLPGLRLHLHPDPEVFPQMEPLVRFEVNSEGERGYPVPRSRPGEKLYRVLVVGGSQPEGYALDQDTSWPCGLQRMLETPEQLERLNASKVHVGNIARSGVGSEGLDVILQRVLPRYPRLSAIIIMVGASDVLRWLEQGAPSTLAPVETSELFKCHPDLQFGWKPSELGLFELWQRRSWLRPARVHSRAGRWVGKARAMRARAKEIRTTMPDAAPMLDHFERHFRSLVERAKAHADRVLVVRQPWFEKESFTPEEEAHMWHGGVGEAWQEEVTVYYSSEIVSRLMTLVDARAARISDELQVEQLDLMPSLERSLKTYYDFFHLTPVGAHAVTTSVATAMLQQPAFSWSRAEDHVTLQRHQAGHRTPAPLLP
jgi:lysophospholipase L1-like esterase